MFSWSEKNYETLNSKHKNSKLVDLLFESDIAALDQFKVKSQVDQIPVKKAPGRPRKAVGKNSTGFPCKDCSKVFHSKHGLHQHAASHATIKPYKCDECNYASKYKASLKAHKETHLNHSPFKCDVCNCFFKQKNCLIQHKGTKKHLTKLKWLADQEKKDRPSKPLDISNDEAEDINGNDFKCDQCSFSTKKKWNLIQHQKTHSTHNPFKCNICGFQTKWKCSLDTHLSTKKHKIALQKSQILQQTRAAVENLASSYL